MESNPGRRRTRLGLFVVGIAVGSGLVLAAVAIYALTTADRLPSLSRAALDTAQQRWQTAGPKDYQVEVRVGGRQPGQIHVEVRAGEVTAMTRNGVPSTQPRTWDYWSVDGLLELIDTELTAAEDPAQAKSMFGVSERSSVLQDAEFDEQLGYPRRYRRSVLGTPSDVEWEITRFQPVQ